MLFDQQPGNGGGVTQVYGELKLWRAEEGVLAGQPAYEAGALGVQCQVVVPQGAMARLGDAVEAMAAPVVQGRAQF